MGIIGSNTTVLKGNLSILIVESSMLIVFLEVCMFGHIPKEYLMSKDLNFL